MTRFVGALWGLVLLVGCAGAPGSETGSNLPPSRTAGLLTLEADGFALRPCDGAALFPLTDQTGGDLGAAFAALGMGPDGELFVVLELDGPSRAAVRVVAAAPVAATGACDERDRDIAAWAGGNEPFWGLAVAPGGIEFFDMARQRELVFPAAQMTPTQDGFVYRTAQPGDAAPVLVVTFRASRCVDSMSGAWSSHAVELTFDDAEFSGCGRIGALFEAAE